MDNGVSPNRIYPSTKPEVRLWATEKFTCNQFYFLSRVPWLSMWLLFVGRDLKPPPAQLYTCIVIEVEKKRRIAVAWESHHIMENYSFCQPLISIVVCCMKWMNEAKCESRVLIVCGKAKWKAKQNIRPDKRNYHWWMMSRQIYLLSLITGSPSTTAPHSIQKCSHLFATSSCR